MSTLESNKHNTLIIIWLYYPQVGKTKPICLQLEIGHHMLKLYNNEEKQKQCDYLAKLLTT